MNYNAEIGGTTAVYQRNRYRDGRAQPVPKKEEQSCKRPLETVEVGTTSLKPIKIEKEQHLCQKARHRREENLGDELIEIDKEEFYHKKTKRRINGDRGDLVTRKCAYVHIDNEQLHLSLAAASAGLVRVADKSKFKRAKEIKSVVKEEDDEELNSRSKRMRKCMPECTNRAQLVESRSHNVKVEKETVKIENENPSTKSKLIDVVKQEDGRLSSKKAVVVKDEPDDGTSTGYSDVEILDIAPLVEKGISCPFVSSKKFHESMVEDRELGPSATDDFREGVLAVLRKPFDKAEYRRYREEIKAGSYLHHHPDVQRKLKKYRYKQEKCMIILRGFFFWLQNLSREGAFYPWRDEQCLAVKLP